MFVNILTWLVIGLVVGLLARLAIPGKQKIGWIATIVIGIVAALIGGFVSYSLLDIDDDGGIKWIPLIVSVVLGALGVSLYTRLAARSAAKRDD